MSIIFSAFPKPEVISHSNLFWCEKEETTFAQSDAALVEAKNHEKSCGDCVAYGGVLQKENLLVEEVQMSNSNALAFLKALGLPDEYAGEVNAQHFFDRITLLNLDSSDLITPNQKKENMYLFGRDSDYVLRRLSQLSELSNWARKNNSTITWG